MNRYIYAICFLLLTNTISCKKDFLNVSNGNIITRQEYVKDLTTTGEYLNGVYTMLGSNFFYGYHLIYPDLIADNIKPVTGSTALSFHYNWAQQASEDQSVTISSSSININGLSYALYKIISACNFVIQKAGEYSNQDPKRADALMGQAYAIRALGHFFLVNAFAQPYKFTGDASHSGIVYMTTNDWTQSVTRQTVAEVYNNLISDLNNSIRLLDPRLGNNTLSVNHYAAEALLARIYLFKGDYANAKTLAKKVSDAVPIMVNDYPEKLFTNQETEALFQVPPESTEYFTLFSGCLFSSNYSLEFLATEDISNIINENPNDKRNAWITNISEEWHITKFPIGVVPDYSIPEGGYYQTVIRSSEMYLTVAESYAMLNNEDSARFYLDAIRMRADQTAKVTIATGNALLDSIYKERRKELAFEGFRMFDLLRLKKGVNRIDAPGTTVKYLPFPSNKSIAPIPALDVRLSGLLQNLGY